MKIINSIKGYAIPLLCGISFFLILRFILFVGFVPTSSMAPTIPEKSFIMGTRIYGSLQKGDVVVFKLNGAVLVKRIVALPGETVYIDDRTSTVSVGIKPSYSTRILVVPDDFYFVLGDNSDHSIDSRTWQDPFIPRESIVAKFW